MFRFFSLIWLLFSFSTVNADVVKPALVEINVDRTGVVSIEIRASIEALLTGINAQYRNTQDAPAAIEYDVLRKLTGEQLKREFTEFKSAMLGQVYLLADNKKVELHIKQIDIPEAGYTKVPRISIIQLNAQIPSETESLRWYYPASYGDNAVRVRQVNLKNNQWHWSSWQWLRNNEVSQNFSLLEIFTKPPLLKTVWSYMVVGFEHIVPKGTDHILFIVGLFLFSMQMKPLLWQVTMFTLAHTITLGLSMNGIIALPAFIVEPLIALSIAYVGLENIFVKTLQKSRLVLVFGFGLLHGLGFASVLNDFGMPEDDFVTALISFNIGVELGQLFIIALAFSLIGYWFGRREWYRKIVIVPGSALIAIIGLFWTFERLTL